MHPLLIRIVTVIHRALYRWSGGRVGARMGGPCLLLTTTGRKSGEPRTAPLLYVEYQGGWVVIASYGGNARHPAWWLNLTANPEATVQVGRTVTRVRAREADGGERQALWDEAVKMYPPYENYKSMTKRRIPVVVLEPR